MTGAFWRLKIDRRDRFDEVSWQCATLNVIEIRAELEGARQARGPEAGKVNNGLVGDL